MSKEVYSENQGTYISGVATTQVATGRAEIVGILVGTTDAGAITVYNEIGSGTTDIKAVLKASIAENYYPINVICSTGIKVVTAASPTITVVWGQT